MPIMINNGDEGGPWTPPQLASLVGAWVAGLSGPVAKLGSWSGQYGTTRAATLVSDALVSSANGLELLTTGDYGTAGATTLGNGRGAFSLACWYQRRGATLGSGYPALIASIASANVYVGLITAPNSNPVGAPHCVYGNRSSGAGDPIASATPPLNEWHHYTATYDGTNLRLYVDGALVGVAKESTRTVSLSPGTILIGTRETDFLTGYLDALYAWDGVAISPADITSLYSADPYRRA